MNTQTSLIGMLPNTRKATATAIIVLALTMIPPRKTQAEDSLAGKFMYYQEDKDRIRVMAPELSVQQETESGWVIKLDGIYNAISGATPVGAPPPARAPVSAPRPTASSSGGTSTASSPSSSPTPPPSVTPPKEENDALFSRSRNFAPALFSAVSGATPAPTPTPTPAPSTPSSGPSRPPAVLPPAADLLQQPNRRLSRRLTPEYRWLISATHAGLLILDYPSAWETIRRVFKRPTARKQITYLQDSVFKMPSTSIKRTPRWPSGAPIPMTPSPPPMVVQAKPKIPSMPLSGFHRSLPGQPCSPPT